MLYKINRPPQDQSPGEAVRTCAACSREQFCASALGAISEKISGVAPPPWWLLRVVLRDPIIERVKRYSRFKEAQFPPAIPLAGGVLTLKALGRTALFHNLATNLPVPLYTGARQ
jgi:hypothetical protein